MKTTLMASLRTRVLENKTRNAYDPTKDGWKTSTQIAVEGGCCVTSARNLLAVAVKEGWVECKHFLLLVKGKHRRVKHFREVVSKKSCHGKKKT